MISGMKEEVTLSVRPLDVLRTTRDTDLWRQTCMPDDVEPVGIVALQPGSISFFRDDPTRNVLVALYGRDTVGTEREIICALFMLRPEEILMSRQDGHTLASVQAMIALGFPQFLEEPAQKFASTQLTEAVTANHTLTV